MEIVAPDRENPRNGKQSPWTAPIIPASVAFRSFAFTKLSVDFLSFDGTNTSDAMPPVCGGEFCYLQGDNGRWQINYSSILGNLAAGGISNLYYPAKDRNAAGLTFENALIGIGASAAANLLQEFVILEIDTECY